MKFILLGIFAVVIIGGGAFLFSQNQVEETEPTAQVAQSTETSTQESREEPAEQVAETGGQYIDYSADAIAANADKKIVIFFHAEWCPNCRAIEKTVLAGSIPSNIVILKANYDTETELRKKYGVTQQTTMVQVDGEGNKVNIWIATAFDDIEAIKENLT